MRYFIGLIMVAFGYLMVSKATFIAENFGAIAWAEKHLGTEGGSRIFYKILGIILILLGFSVITGLLQPMLLSILSPFFGGPKQ